MNTNDIDTEGDIKDVFRHFQIAFVSMAANTDRMRWSHLTMDFAKLFHQIAKDLGAVHPYSDEASVEKLFNETIKMIEEISQLISLAKKRDSAKNN